MNHARFTLATQMLSIAVVSLLVVSILSDSIVDRASESATKTQDIIDSRLNGGQLQVQPSSGPPQPLDSPLQSTPGSGSGQQNTDQDLQPQTSNPLHPNSGSDQIPEASGL